MPGYYDAGSLKADAPLPVIDFALIRDIPMIMPSDEMSYSRAIKERFAEAGFTPMSADKGKNGQPKFIYLFNEPDLGRLSEEDAALFDELDAGAGEDAVFRFAQMAAATYQNTMLKGQSDDVNAEFFPDLYNRGILPGNSIIFFFRDRISADRMEDEDIAFEQKKDRIFANVKQQFEQLASREKAYHTWLFRM
jgi:hypothetical protein